MTKHLIKKSKIWVWVKRLLSFGCRLTVAIILIQTLRHKFLGSELSKHIFESIGVEPWGRILVGCFELVTGVLILIPTTVWIGALSGLILMGGAVYYHLSELGIEVKDDGGTLFGMALLVTTLSALCLLLHKEQIGDLPFLKKKNKE